MPVMSPRRNSDDKNKNMKRLIFWFGQGVLTVFFILISYAASLFIFQDVLRLTVEKFPTIYLLIPVSIFLILVLLDVLFVYFIKYFMAKPLTYPETLGVPLPGGNKEGWIKYKNIIILVSAHIFLGILFLAISLGLSYLLFYILSRWEHEPDFLLIVLVTFFLFILQIVWYVKSCAISVNSTEMGVKRVFQSPRKIIKEGLNLLWWIVEDLILVPRERFEIEFLVDGVRTKPGQVELYEHVNEKGETVKEYDVVDRQEVNIEAIVYANFGEDEENLFSVVRYLPSDILAAMRSTISDDEIMSLIKFEKGRIISDDEKKEIFASYKMRPLAPEQRKYIMQIAVKRHYDSLIKNLVRKMAADETYPELDKKKEALVNGIQEILQEDETFKKTGLSSNIQIVIGQIILPKEIEDAIKAREVARKKKQADIVAAEGKKQADMLNSDAKSYEGMKQADVKKYEKRTKTEADLEALGLKDPKLDGVKPGKEDTAMKLVAMMETLGAIKESDFKIFEAEGASKVFERIVDHNLEKFIKKS